MILKKITDDHYVVVDDSEINEDCYALHEGPLGEREIVTANGQCKLDKKITHSTIPKGMMLMEGIERLSLKEVKELIGEVDVEKKIKEWYDETKYDSSFIADPYSYKAGYKQAIEDNKDKKYTEMDMKKAFYKGIDSWMQNPDALESIINDFRQSLQRKTEWEVEFHENGKLKLK